MILFKPEHVEPILSGCKTQTRRLGKKRWKVGSVHQCRLSYRMEPFAYVRVTAVRRERLGNITDDDARREGYLSVEAYREAFERIYGFWDPDVDVWVVDFELVRQS
ncbi:ASCH domain-containing protein [Desulfofundulus australicus DSM 11792]|uniref:ASCH domain-containing protein n=1 Tax=Desulfofundulus australicus DSM 11792 TaxID=1121425 RepID=A0A1M4XSR2_9FIRM|nr:ASCH domain-containing protein [Desulfofundulus australicus DSM 11792]